MVCLWSMINQIQLFFYLLLTGMFIPESIKIAITGPSFALNPFESISLGDSSRPIIKKFNFNPSSPVLSDFEIESESTFYNIYSLIFSMLIVVWIHLICLLLLKPLTSWSSGKWSRLFKVLLFIVEKIFKILTFGYYIRFALEINQYMLISAITEIYNFRTSDPIMIVSLSISFILLVLWLGLIVFAACLSLSSYEIKEKQHNQLDEFFTGLKPEKKYRVYIAILLSRRIIFVIMLLTFKFWSPTIVVSILVLLQLAYLIYMCILRPFDDIKANVIEIINETVFLILLCSLLLYSSELKWTETSVFILIFIMVLNSLIVFIIITGKIDLVTL